MSSRTDDPAIRRRTAGTLNWANALTFVRLCGSVLLFALILDAEDTSGTSWAAAAYGWLLGATDYYDGKLARRGRVSRTGAFLDPLADKTVVLGGMTCLVVVGRYWWLPVAIVAAREIGITLYRSYWARHGLAIPARRSAKYKTLVQGLAIFIAVLPPLEDHPLPVNLALWIAVGFTVVSGVQYLLDGRHSLSHTGAHT